MDGWEYGSVLEFQPTPPHRGRQWVPGHDNYVIGHFNPRPRTGGDFPLYPSCKSISRISTHAPAQGATLKSSTTAEFAQISTHAPAQGATGAVKH